jgi:hypothetical protein
MDFTPRQISNFRFWIQGYSLFYEPLVAEYFRVMGYQVTDSVTVRKPDIQKSIDAIFDGHKRLGPDLKRELVIEQLRSRDRIQPDLFLEKDGQSYLAELKSWGGYRTGQFDLGTARTEFIESKPDSLRKSSFFLIDWLDGKRITGKVLVVSSRSPQHDQVLELLTCNFNTPIQLLYLDEIFKTPQLEGIMEKYFAFLDAAVADLKQALRGNRP